MLRNQVPDILGLELNSFLWPNTFPLATNVLTIAEMFNYYEKWNFNWAINDSKEQLGVLMLLSAVISQFLLSPSQFQ